MMLIFFVLLFVFFFFLCGNIEHHVTEKFEKTLSCIVGPTQCGDSGNYCTSGNVCCSDGTCAPMGSENSKCENCCSEQNKETCLNGKCCENGKCCGTSCCEDGKCCKGIDGSTSCIPKDGNCCKDINGKPYFCPKGYKCHIKGSYSKEEMEMLKNIKDENGNPIPIGCIPENMKCCTDKDGIRRCCPNGVGCCPNGGTCCNGMCCETGTCCGEYGKGGFCCYTDLDICVEGQCQGPPNLSKNY